MMKYALAAMLSLATLAPAYAGDMEDSENLGKAQEKLDEAAKKVAEQCGGPVTGKHDPATFKGKDPVDYANYCVEALAAVGSTCESHPKYKATVLKAVKTVTCHYDASITTGMAKTKIVRNGTNIDVSYNKKSANVGPDVGNLLTKSL